MIGVVLIDRVSVEFGVLFGMGFVGQYAGMVVGEGLARRRV